MAKTLVTLAINQEGKLRHLTVEMSGDDLQDALAGPDRLVPLPTGQGKSTWVNPAYVVLAQEREDDDSGPGFSWG
jgi:hypothetical protein